MSHGDVIKTPETLEALYLYPDSLKLRNGNLLGIHLERRVFARSCDSVWPLLTFRDSKHLKRAGPWVAASNSRRGD